MNLSMQQCSFRVLVCKICANHGNFMPAGFISLLFEYLPPAQSFRQPSVHCDYIANLNSAHTSPLCDWRRKASRIARYIGAGSPLGMGSPSNARIPIGLPLASDGIDHAPSKTISTVGSLGAIHAFPSISS